MKVIVAGMPKTGTKSMQAALTELGYNVYDVAEHFSIHGDEWRKICLAGATTEEFRQMYKDVDAITDIPASYFWDEIHNAFPDSKIILTMRDSEDEWMASFREHIKQMNQLTMVLLGYFSPTRRSHSYMKKNYYIAVFGTYMEGFLFSPPRYNELLMKMTYRRHNSHVLQTAPNDKLLIFNVKEGWEPLCKFLEKDVPDKPFPRKNVKGELANELLKNSPTFARYKREAMLSVVLMSVLIGYGGYKLFRKFRPCAILQSISQSCGNIFALFKT